MASCLLCLLMCSFFGTTNSADDPTAKIKPGVLIKGVRMTTIKLNREFSAFYGLPYAEPPTEDRRFRHPVPKKWTVKDFDATKEGPECAQTDVRQPDSLRGQEDCLILNVFTHNTSRPLRKVTVFIHGGGFKIGSSNEYGPRRLLDRDVVHVSINYRLWAFGFLSTMDKASPGNYGLLDQTEALKWIQTNIEAFGGDPNKVTIIGQSAGSVSVVDHMISPRSKGLFHRAIAHSGNVFHSYAEYCDPMHWTELLANGANCLRPTKSEMVECLRRVPAEKLVQQTDILALSGARSFGPVHDGYFFSDLPSKLLRAGRISNPVPIMIGMTKDEGILVAANEARKSPQLTNEFIAKQIGTLLNQVQHKIPLDVIEMVRKRYLDEPDVTETTENLQVALNSLLTDSAGFAPLIETATTLVNHGIKPFVFSYGYVTNHSVLKYYGIDEPLGDAHQDDLSFLFDSYFFESVMNVSNDETEEKFLDIWMHFAENGRPTEVGANVDWKPATKGHINICHLDREITFEDYQPDKDWRINFWERKLPARVYVGKCKKKRNPLTRI